MATITGQVNSIIGPDCDSNYRCPRVTCNDHCYWKVTGNNILLDNIFGTLSNDDVRLQTNGTHRGIFEKFGLFGWNTMSPTAYLHVRCSGHNEANGLSDVRFEKLEQGKGNILVIDEDGYVFDSGTNLNDLFNMLQKRQDEKTTELRQEVEALKQQVQSLLNEKSMDQGIMKGTGNILYQNNPNPFSDETEIAFDIKDMRSKASLVVYDLNGKQIKSYPIDQKGSGKITVEKGTLSAGIYQYSLLVDGVENSTKRMILTN